MQACAAGPLTPYSVETLILIRAHHLQFAGEDTPARHQGSCALDRNGDRFCNVIYKRWYGHKPAVRREVSFALVLSFSLVTRVVIVPETADRLVQSIIL